MPSHLRQRWTETAKRWTPPAVLDVYRVLRDRIAGRIVEAPSRATEARFQLPERRLGELFPGAEEIIVTFPAQQILRRRDMVLPHAELLTLAALCRRLQPRAVFEIGTYTGSGTLLIAMNTPDEAEVVTLDLEPEKRDEHQHGLGVGGFAGFSVGSAFRAHAAAAKIRQVYGDSTTFDYAPYYGKMDLVLIDADHTYDFVKADSENALRLLRPGGVLLWDDYVWEAQWSECEGVTRYVNELSRSRSCYRIIGTRFAIHIAGESEGST